MPQKLLCLWCEDKLGSGLKRILDMSVYVQNGYNNCG